MKCKTTLLLGLFLALLWPHDAQASEWGYNSGANTNVRVMAVQLDNKVLLGGSFTTLGGVSRSHIGRLNPDGTLDAFNPVLSSLLYCPLWLNPPPHRKPADRRKKTLKPQSTRSTGRGAARQPNLPFRVFSVFRGSFALCLCVLCG